MDWAETEKTMWAVILNTAYQQQVETSIITPAQVFFSTKQEKEKEKTHKLHVRGGLVLLASTEQMAVTVLRHRYIFYYT